MAAKACVVEKFPGGDIDVIVGDKVPVSLRMKNCGNEKGIFYSDIRKDGRSFVSRYNESLNVNSITSIGKDLTMPNYRVQLDFYGGHAEGSTWHQDFHYTVYLHPRAPRACVVEKSPGGDIDVIVGDKVPVSLRMKNCGSASGTFYSEIKKDGSTLVSRYNESLNVNAITSIGRDVTMPDRRVQLDFYGGHTEGGTRHQDFHSTVHLNPRQPPSPATGNLRVTSTPSGAKIWIKPSDSLVLYSTGSTTPRTIIGLAVGACEVKVTKAGYKDSEVKTVTIIKDQTASVSFTLTVAAPPAGQWSKQDFIDELTKRGRIPIEDLPDSIPSGGGWYDMYGNDKYARYLGKKCNSKNFGIAIRLKPYSPCSGNNPPTESDCISWEYDTDHYTYGVAGSVPMACAKKALDELYAPPAAKLATVICNFSVRDSADKEVTDLVAGTQYTVKAWLCWVPEGPIPGGPCRLTGCPSGREVSNEELKLFLLGQAAEVATGTTDANGYTSMFWTPSRSIVGTDSIRLEFKGNAKYNAVESAWKTVNVGTPCKFTVNCVGYNVGTEVNCTEMVHLLGIFWIPAPIPLNVKKKIPSSKTVEFSTADGLKLNKYYAFTAFPKAWTDAVIENEVYVCSGDKTITITKVGIVERKLCSFFGIDPTSNQCTMFFAEFSDPVFVANTISVITKHEDLAGNHRDPEVLDYVFLPLVILGSLAPEIPVGKICKFSGKGLKLAKKTRATRAFFEQYGSLIDEAVAKGDKTRLNNFVSAIEAENLDEALRILEDCVKNPSVGRASIFKRLRGWWRKGDDSLKKSASVTKSEDALGDVTKATTKVVDNEAAKVAGRFGEIKKVWTDFCKTPDDVVYLDKHLAGRPDDFKVMHNLMRYTKSEYINALKAEEATVPELGTRFNEGIEFMLNHIGDEKGLEVTKYREAIKGLSGSDISNIVKNLDNAGQTNLARIINLLKVKPERGMGYFDGVNAALKGTKKLTRNERKATGAVLDKGIDDAMSNLDAKWLETGKTALKTEKDPLFQRFWNYVKGSPKAKDAMAAQSVSRFRDLPRWAKLSVLVGVFFAVNSAWKWLQDFCFGLFMGEETLQWAGFGGISLQQLLKDFDKKPLARRKEIIATFEDFYNKRAAIHAFVTGTPMPALGDKELNAPPTLTTGPLTGIFEHLCVLFGKYFKGFWEADRINLWALAQTIDDLKRGINPYTGIGVCSIKVQANKDGVRFWYQGSPTKWYGGKAYYTVEIKDVPVREKPYVCSVMAWLPGYKVATQNIEIYPTDVGATGAKAKTLPLFEMVPESELTDTHAGDPFPIQTGPDTSSLPTPYGNANPTEYFTGVSPTVYGSIECESIPEGADVYLDKKDAAHYKGKTNIKLDHIPTGAHRIIQTFPGFNDCVVNVNVVVEPTVYARCRFSKPTCSFTSSTLTPKVGEGVTFNAGASTPGTGATSLTYDWDWGDGKPHGTQETDTHAYASKGNYVVKLTITNEFGGSDTCTRSITVGVTAGGIRCYCEPAEYCDRHADILVDGAKVDVTKGSGYTYIKNLTPGVHTVKYNLLDVMECTGSVTVAADKDVDFKGQLKSKLPQSQRATVTEIIDGDSIRTDITDALPSRLPGTRQEIRIIGYDAYECHIYPSDCTTFGKYAYEKLKGLIPVGTSITLKIDQWLPLGAHNRVIAGVFVGTKDIAAEMLKSCLVSITEKKYQDRYYWITWPNYDRVWCNPTKAVTSPEHKPEIVDVNTSRRTFKIKNNWLTLWFLTEFVDERGYSLGKSPRGQIGEGRTSSAIAYFAGTYKIDLYARVDEKDDWTLVDTKYITTAPPTTKTVTFRSVPSGASVTVTKVISARSALPPLKRLKKSLKKVRSM